MTITLPGWLARRMMLSALKEQPWLMGMTSNQTSKWGNDIISLETTTQTYLTPEIKDFITNGMTERGCDAITFVKTVRKFPPMPFTWDFRSEADIS